MNAILSVQRKKRVFSTTISPTLTQQAVKKKVEKKLKKLKKKKTSFLGTLNT